MEKSKDVLIDQGLPFVERKRQAIELLKDDNHYYGEFGNQFLSYSRITPLLENPSNFDPKESTPMTGPLLKGAYLHLKVLEPHKCSDMKIADCANRNTKAYKLLAEENGPMLLKHEVDALDQLAEALHKCKASRELLYHDDVQAEVPNIIELDGTWWRGKADALIPGKTIVDLKTTGDISRFKWSARKYNYDAQAYLYSMMFGLPFTFVVICKKSSAIGIFECSEEFLRSGKYKIQEAISNYKLIFKNEEFNNDDFYVRDIL